MTHLGKLVVVGVVALLVGCGQAGPEEQEGQEEVLSSTPERDEGSVHAFAACQSTAANSCVNAGYTSCGSWTAYYSCGTTPVCNTNGCRVYVPPSESSPGHYVWQGSETFQRNRHRVCYNAFGQSCTEYQSSSSTVCGCAL
jgi:hypothetical protein